MEMNKSKRNINLIFRLVTIACFIIAVIGVISVVGSIPKMDDHNLTYAERYKGLFTGMKMYIGVTVGTVICTVLSVMSWKVSHYGFVIARTIFLIITAVFLLVGIKNAVMMTKASNVISEYNISDIDDLTEEQISSSGYTYSELQELGDKLEEISDDELMLMIISYCWATVFYFIMLFTSITSIIKVQAWYIMASDPTNSPEYYAAMRNNMHDKDLANPYAPVNSPMNNAQGFVPQNGYNGPQQGYPEQQGFSYQPANGYNAPQQGYDGQPMNGYGNMQQGYQGQPVNGGYGMGTMEAQFDAMQQSGAYSNGNFSNQNYTGQPNNDDLDDL